MNRRTARSGSFHHRSGRKPITFMPSTSQRLRRPLRPPGAPPTDGAYVRDTPAMRLWLLRHAKSSWSDQGLPDEDRPLAPRGEKAADRMRNYIAAEGLEPQLVLCSSAMRARQTLA